MSKEYWGKGIINISLDFLIAYAKDKLKIEKLIIGTNINNYRSINFIKKFNFIESHQNSKDIYFERILL